jgi:hypothetical protein
MENIYKKDSKGKIIEWRAEVQQNGRAVDIMICYGQLHGEKVVTYNRDIKGKNIGKTNQTTPFEQATFEVHSLYNRKKKAGYKSLEDLGFTSFDAEFSDISFETFLVKNLKFNTTDENDNLKPMKAQQYYRSKKNWLDPTRKLWSDRKYYYLLNPYALKEKNAIIIEFPCLIQPKINGIRATISLNENGVIQILSKEGLEYNLPTISDVFNMNKEIFTHNGENIIFDGELYIHKESLQIINSAVQATNLNTFRLQFICFDIAVGGIDNLNRIKLMKELLAPLLLSGYVDYVKTTIVGNDLRVQQLTDMFIEQGYEGSIMRNPTGLYAFGKRPMDMVKLKRTISEEFKIIDIIPQDKNPELGMFVCRTKKGEEFDVTPTMSNDEKAILLYNKHKYVGKQLTCVFYEYTDKGKPFHIIDNIVRDYE